MDRYKRGEMHLPESQRDFLVLRREQLAARMNAFSKDTAGLCGEVAKL